MTTEEQLRSTFASWGGAIEVPEGAIASTLRAIGAAPARAKAPRARRPLRDLVASHRGLVLGGVLAAALVAVVVAVTIPVTSSFKPGPVEGLRSSSALSHPASVFGPAATNGAAYGSDATASAAAGKVAVPGTGSAPIVPNRFGAASAGTAGSANSASTLPAKIASTGALTIEVPRSRFSRSVAALRAIAVDAGGYVSSSNLVTTKGDQGTVALSVPAGMFASIVTASQKVGTTRSLVTKTDDLSKQVSDVTAQLQALRAVRSQLEGLLSRTAKVSDLLAVEGQIKETETEIDQLQSEQRSLDAEISYATLTVHLIVPPKPGGSGEHQGGFAKAWSTAVNGFVGGIRWLVSISGAVVFGLLVLIALAFAAKGFGRHLWPRVRRIFL